MPISNEMNQNLGDETLEPMNQNSLKETKKEIKEKIKKLENEKNNMKKIIMHMELRKKNTILGH